KQVPDTIGDLDSLIRLNLENNLIYTLPKSLLKLPKLEAFYIYKNRISVDEITNNYVIGKLIDRKIQVLVELSR
ncbi:MAG: hypothetical protein ACW99Q_04820, partial [Candidatus Kariarchaeaceae archaeon]